MSWPSEWPKRDGRAFIALTFQIIGSAVLTISVVWIVHILRHFGKIDMARREQVIEALSNAATIMLFIIAIVLLSLGLAINRRSIRGSAFGAEFEASGGPETAQTVADAAQDEADRIGERR